MTTLMRASVLAALTLGGGCSSVPKTAAIQRTAVGGGFIATGSVTLAATAVGGVAGAIVGSSTSPPQPDTLNGTSLIALAVPSVIGLAEVIAGAYLLQSGGEAFEAAERLEQRNEPTRPALSTTAKADQKNDLQSPTSVTHKVEHDTVSAQRTITFIEVQPRVEMKAFVTGTSDTFDSADLVVALDIKGPSIRYASCEPSVLIDSTRTSATFKYGAQSGSAEHLERFVISIPRDAANRLTAASVVHVRLCDDLFRLLDAREVLELLRFPKERPHDPS